MIFTTITYSRLMDLYLKPIWYAKFTDHPKYTIDYEINERPMEELVVLPTEAMIVDYEIFRENYYSTSLIDVEVRYGDRCDSVRYTAYTDAEKTFEMVTEGYVMGDTYDEVLVEYEIQLLKLIDEYLDYNDRERFVWYVECLEKINLDKAREYIDKHPEQFV